MTLTIVIVDYKIRKHMPNSPNQDFIIGNYDKFCEHLHRLIHSYLLDQEELEADSIMVYMNLHPRHEVDLEKQEQLFLAGSHSMQAIFERIIQYKKYNTSYLQENWKFLRETNLTDEIDGAETIKLFRDYKNNNIKLNDIKPGRLKDYFGVKRDKGIFKNRFQNNEYPIIKLLFDIEKDYYISVPLIQFARFEGVIHILYKAKIHSKFTSRPINSSKEEIDKNIVKRIIKLCSRRYEELLLAWEGVEERIYDKSGEFFHYILSPQYREQVKKNSLLKELNYENFYANLIPYFKDRTKYNDQIPSVIADFARRIATISILIDSYSHNISAHSLTALNWWFRQRSSFIDLKEAIQSKKEEKDQGYDKDIWQLEQELEEYKKAGYKDSNPFLEQTRPMSRELYPLLRFLMEKGAFWTGVSRGNTFGGKISNLGNLLWFDFINNPLYLGTIAFSEGVKKIEVYVILYDKYVSLDRYNIKRTIQDEDLTRHRYASIDLASDKIFDENQFTHIKSEFPQLMEERSKFVNPDKDNFSRIQQQLNRIKVFLPGGVVGKHSLFTLLENEIRNVKHFESEVLELIKQDGLKLVLSIMPKSLDKNSEIEEKELYEIGVWLHHSTQLIRGGINKQGEVEDVSRIFLRYEGSNEDIVDPNHEARLGGTSQDKLCAAMLLNNNFHSVQNRRSIRDRQFYPWVISSSADESNAHLDFVLASQYLSSLNVAGTDSPMISGSPAFESEITEKYYRFVKEARKEYNSKKGYIKKFFHLWKGAEVFHYQDGHSLDLENISRFRFVSLNERSNNTIKEVRKAGIIRVLFELGKNELPWAKWIRYWLPSNGNSVIIFREKEEICAISLLNGFLTFLNKNQLKNNEFDESCEVEIIKLSHGGRYSNRPEDWNYRSHGMLMDKFLRKDYIEELPENLLHELYETLKTKIAIFDNRVFKRIPTNKSDFFDSALKIKFFEENQTEWRSFKASSLKETHFLVIHLSFIEKLLDEDGIQYGEKRIPLFIKEQILPQVQGRDNFILVITTGRGRREWWENILKTPYTSFTTFRPIESLITSVENAVQKKDDFELKYNLIKTLFGS